MAEERRDGGTAKWITLVAMTLSTSMVLVDQTAVPLATPDVVQDLGASLADGSWILTANILPLAALLVLGGRLGDLLGLRRVFITGAALFAVSTAMAGLADSMTWLIAARVAQGVGAALMMPTSVAITSAVWPRNVVATRSASSPGRRRSSVRPARCSAAC